MRGHRLLLVLGVCALLVTPSAGGDPAVPGDPTPPVVTPHFFGTQGLNGWWVSNVTLNWTVEDPESQILETRGCDAVTLTTDTVGTSFTCYARSDGGETHGHGHDQARHRPGPWSPPRRRARPIRTAGTTTGSRSASAAPTRPREWVRACAPQSYSGPDNANASVAGSCQDRAGNVTVRNFALSYDATAPTGDRRECVALARIETAGTTTR